MMLFLRFLCLLTFSYLEKPKVLLDFFDCSRKSIWNCHFTLTLFWWFRAASALLRFRRSGGSTVQPLPDVIAVHRRQRDQVRGLGNSMRRTAPISRALSGDGGGSPAKRSRYSRSRDT